MKQVIRYGEIKGVPLNVTFYPTAEQTDKAAIIYFHGGGLIFGSRKDLPNPYITEFTKRGYPLIAVDYPLAPESKLKDIFTSIGRFFQWFDAHYHDKLGLSSSRKFLFGRSAGAYLALQWGKKIHTEGIISFYGYYTFFHNDFTNPSSNFTKYPELSINTINSSTSEKTLVESTVEERFPLYFYYRQKGIWVKNLINEETNLDNYSLTVNDLKEFPPTFLAASRNDEDVPFFLSNMMSKKIPDNTFIKLNDLPHDFDRYPELESSKAVYSELLEWLDKRSVS
uniref:alpha/beta hydrolase n=1 Tax=Candidatus Enterococcus willemsii TaxID=1857215 RepID=UPI00403F2022